MIGKQTNFFAMWHGSKNLQCRRTYFNISNMIHYIDKFVFHVASNVLDMV